MIEQGREQPERLLLQLDAGVPFSQFTLGGPQFEFGKLVDFALHVQGWRSRNSGGNIIFAEVPSLGKQGMSAAPASGASG